PVACAGSARSSDTRYGALRSTHRALFREAQIARRLTFLKGQCVARIDPEHSESPWSRARWPNGAAVLISGGLRADHGLLGDGAASLRRSSAAGKSPVFIRGRLAPRWASAMQSSKEI